MTARQSKYLTWLAQQPCIVNGERGVEIAHVVGLASPKTGQPLARRLGPSIIYAVPLSAWWHRLSPHSIHALGERGFEHHHGWPEYHLLRYASMFMALYILEAT